MSSEIGSTDFDRLDQWNEGFIRSTPTSDPKFHTSIYSPGNEHWRFTKHVILQVPSLELAEKTQNVARKSSVAIAPMNTKGGSVEGGVTANWGGNNGLEFTGYVKGEVYDNKGNIAKIEIEQNSDGTGGLSASTKYDYERDLEKKNK